VWIAATPFSTPGLFMLDAARLLMTAGGFLLVGFYLRLRWPTTADRYEKARALGMALALFVLAASRAVNLGQPIAWQFVASAAVFGLVGYSAIAPTRRPRR
jgi:hypothetical protein